jgi:hypothetical protein
MYLRVDSVECAGSGVRGAKSRPSPTKNKEAIVLIMTLVRECLRSYSRSRSGNTFEA